uniref:Integral membrane family protein n=1 Tax=Solanum tuberosum TaxID=4113 RepID=M1CX80_SOLTU
MTKSCFTVTSDVHFVVKNPRTTNVNPMTVPAAAAAKSPAFVTPPFVPLRTV